MGHTAESIRHIIRRERTRRGWSEQELAARLGAVSGNYSLTQGRISEWETGKRGVGMYWLHWIAVVFDLPPDDLMYVALGQRNQR